MKKEKRITGFIVVLVMILSLTIFPEFVMGEDTVKITVLATSDIHGKIFPWEYATDSYQEWGLAKLSTLISKEREKDPNLLLLDNGDTIESNMISLFNNEEEHPMIKVFNYLNYDTWTLGNHEFNFGLDILNRAIKTFKGDTLSANITKDDGTSFVKPYVIKEIKGIKIGIIGMTTPHIPRWEAASPDHFLGLNFNDPLATAQNYVDELKNKENVDVVIGMFHIGRNSENYDPTLTDGVKDILENVSGIDAVVAGHAHEMFGQKDDQIFYNDTIVLEPGSDGKYLGKLEIELVKDKDKYRIVSKQSDILSVSEVDEDTKILEMMKYVDDKSKEEAYKVVGKATGDFVPPESIKGVPEGQIKDTALMDLVNKVQLFYSGAEISSNAMFDTRSNLLEGELKFKDVALIYKYSNTMQTHKITGKNLKTYMEWSANYYNTQKEGDVTVSFNPEIRAYNYDMFMGIDYQIDITKEPGNRIVNATINKEPIDDNREYILATSNYRVGTLQSLGLLPKDGNESLVFDSTSLETPEMQRLIQKYISEELNGVAIPEVDNNWSLILNDYTSLEGGKEAIYLINNDIIKVPVSEDGRTPNVKAINVLEKADDDYIKLVCNNAKIDVSSIQGTQITKGNLYAQVYRILNNEKLNNKVINNEEKNEEKNDKTKSDDILSQKSLDGEGINNDKSIKDEKSSKNNTNIIKYTVKSGDTLWDIGKKYNVDWKIIAHENEIQNPDLIYPGQVFIIHSK